MTDSSAAADELKRALSAEEGSRLWLRRGAIVGVIALAIGGGLVWRAKHKPPPPARYVSQTVTMGDVIEKVQATGAVPAAQGSAFGLPTGGGVRVPGGGGGGFRQ
jgi:hypothetical protein